MSRLDTLTQPLFEEIPVPPPAVHAPLGAPPSWFAVVVDRARLQCECAGQCGVTHARSAGRRPRKHDGWANRKSIVLAVAPKPPGLLLPLHLQAALPDAELMAWCEDCQRKATAAARGPAK